MGTSISAILTVTTAAQGTTPGQATALTVTNILSTSLTLSWSAPSVGTQPLNYQPRYSTDGGNTWTNATTSTTTSLSVNITGLTANTSYVFDVVTSNASGTSTSAQTGTVTTASVVPGAPTGLALNGAAGSTSVALTWNAPTTGTGPFSYQILSRTPTGSGSFAQIATASTNSITITGLSPSTSYDFEVIAVNGAGSGPTSSPLTNVVTAATSAVLPSSPQNLSNGTITTTSIVLNWTTPATGTAPLTYTVQYQRIG